jgi:hypothetical protein
VDEISASSISKMEKETITKLNKTIEESAYEQDGVEYWLPENCKNFWVMPNGVIFRRRLKEQKKTAKPVMKRSGIILLTSTKWSKLVRI